MREEDKDRGRGRLTKGKWFGVSAVQSMSEAPLLGKLQPEASTMDLLQAEHAAIELQLEDTATPAENLQRLITECGVSPTKVAELVQELPPKDFANILVDWFFAKINSSRYPIHEGMFRGASPCQCLISALHSWGEAATDLSRSRQSFLSAAYESLYANGLKTDPSNVRSLPLVFIVLATVRRIARCLSFCYLLASRFFTDRPCLRHAGRPTFTRAYRRRRSHTAADLAPLLLVEPAEHTYRNGDSE